MYWFASPMPLGPPTAPTRADAVAPISFSLLFFC